jgi:hypothetical protein
MTRLQAPYLAAMVSSALEEGRGREESRSGRGCPRRREGHMRGGGKLHQEDCPAPAVGELLYRVVWERKKETGRRKKKRGKKEREGKNVENFPNMKIFKEENKI